MLETAKQNSMLAQVPSANNLMADLMGQLNNMGLSIEGQPAPSFKGYQYYKQMQTSPPAGLPPPPPSFANAL
jgi:hypothetical protein